ncbi:hypothetical protein WHR41_03948 [Cladosporium halotolerans]|uniref:Postreplication repair E3 ubiquitin-protein ligase RAD18 n=1 Tax=Cladosporium halotolerans TaxID=1052096 RepID=A0AB34KQE5_9PEZI
MDSAYDVPDSTDWLNTPLAALADLENALHCQICKEFYDTPMITSCSHTFCSRCIRTSLSADGRCPACRASDQASKLRNNWQLQEVVSTFLAARPQAIQIARAERDNANNARKPGKRKRAVLDSDEIAEVEKGGRTTRSKSRRTEASQLSQQETIEVEDSEGDDDFEPEQPKDDGLVECPLGCGKRMKIEAVEPHLDRCEDEKEAEKRAKSRTPLGAFGGSRASPRQTPRPQDRISELNYSLLKEGAMRKKMDELGLPSFGSKQLMVRRHTEWVNLWNASCDSSRARSKRDLLHDLDTWERTQGGKAPTSSQGHAIMRKDFDGAGWANKNKDDFSRLIADARRKKNATPAEPASKSEGVEGMGSSATHPDENPMSDGTLPQASSSQQCSGNAHANPSESAELGAPTLSTNGMHGTSSNLDNPQSPIQQPSEPANGHLEKTISGNGGDRRRESQDYHLNSQDGKEPCELPSHVATSPLKKMPMFSIPHELSET